MKSALKKNRKRSSKIAFLLYPIAFFGLGSVITLLILKPIISPLYNVIDFALSQEELLFDKEASDIFSDKDKTSLPTESKLIKVNSSDIPAEGERFGQVIIDKANVDAPLYYGDSERELSLGIGSYTGAYIPGAGRTILLAGHNNTIFGNIGLLEEGDLISIETSYGKYIYEVTGNRIALDTDTTAYDLKSETENLIMYTCYPFEQLGLTPQRYFVYAKYLQGPKLDLVY